MRLKDMTTKEAIRQLQDMKQYCTAKSIPALDYAIKALKENAAAEEAATSRQRPPAQPGVLPIRTRFRVIRPVRPQMARPCQG